MLNLPFDPVVRRRDDGLQLSYQLPHRAYDTKSYPIQAPNGSTIIIYGHDLGIRILWRGGRPFKPQQPKSNGAQNDNDAIMISDSDDEDAAPMSAKNGPQPIEFEGEDDEIDPSRPYQAILRHIDIQLGVKVLGLSVPTFSSEQLKSSLDQTPQIFSDIAVIAAVCADCSIRVLAIPLTPPPNPQDSSSWGLQTATISAGSVQAIPAGVSVTFTARKLSDRGSRYRSQSRSRSTKNTPDSRSGSAWDLLVAAHSAEGSGTLTIYRVPILDQPDQNGSYKLPSEPILPIQNLLLPSPAKAISFNPSQYPYERHSHLLVSFANGSVKVYACLSSKPRKPTTDRRGSSSEADIKDEGTWLITLFPEFCQNSLGIPRRKTVLDAKWVLGGKAIMVLLSDGSWGIWDPEGSGPGSKDYPITPQNQGATSSARAGSLTSFAVSGRISGPLPMTKPVLSGPAPDNRSNFIPMTPSTRRLREDTLFKGSSVSAPPASSTRGGISVATTKISRDGLPDESIIIWHGDQNIRISSLLTLWRNSTKPAGTFDPSSRSRAIPIENINLIGEIQNGIAQVVGNSAADKEIVKAAKPDVLITAEHQLILLTQEPSEQGSVESASALQKDPNVSMEGDQIMLRRGELDLDGMDRVLSGMTGSRVAPLRSPQKKGLFS
ncbi:hypothetical protein FQN52_003358 [Onygenales sp. PD_12]|nr:hypothetical protein FQN52_003358 [Onygenales sp. PD_12]